MESQAGLARILPDETESSKAKQAATHEGAQPLHAPLLPNEIWSLDFMSDSLYQGRRFRTLNILDEGVREAYEVREITHQWLQSYKQERPHDALGSLPPAVFREKLLAGKNSTSELSP
jgi:hypothetical protein